MSNIVNIGEKYPFFLEAGAWFTAVGGCEVWITRGQRRNRQKINAIEQQIGPFLSDAQILVEATALTTLVVRPAEPCVPTSILSGEGVRLGAAVVALTPKSAGAPPSEGTVAERLSHEIFVSDRVPGGGGVTGGRAHPGRDSEWNDAAWEEHFLAAVANGHTILFNNIYRLKRPKHLDMSAVPYLGRLASLKGLGGAQAQIHYSGAPGDRILEVTLPPYANVPYAGNQPFGNFTIRGTDPAVSGDGAFFATRDAIKWNRGIGVHWLPIRIYECNQGVELIDVVHLSSEGLLEIGFGNYGIKATVHNIAGGLGASPVNEVQLRVKLHNLRQHGVDLLRTNNWLLTGSMEAIGRPGAYIADALRFGLRITDGGFNGPWVLNWKGHVESAGFIESDFLIVHGPTDGIYRIESDFPRNGLDFSVAQDGSGIAYPNHNIKFSSTGASQSVLDVRGSGFTGVNSYPVDAARKYIVHSGTLDRHQFLDDGVIYQSDVERPVFLQNRIGSESQHFAWVMFNSAGAILKTHNGFNVVKNSTGNYTFNFASLNRTTVFPHSWGATHGAPITMRPVARTRGSIQVLFETPAGVPVDPSIDASVFVGFA